MARTAIRYNTGFSLVEAMIATLILTVMMLWSVQGLIGVTQAVSNNKIRQDAVKLGQDLLVDARGESYVGLLSWDSANFPANATWSAAVAAAPPIPAIPAGATFSRQIASYNINFLVTRTVSTIVGGSKLVTLNISWNRGGSHNYVAQTVVSNR